MNILDRFKRTCAILYFATAIFSFWVIIYALVSSTLKVEPVENILIILIILILSALSGLLLGRKFTK